MDRKEAIRAYKETRAQLRLHSHPDKRLQMDWDTEGPEAFDFEVLDLLERPIGSTDDPAEELAVLEELWREKVGGASRERY